MKKKIPLGIKDFSKLIKENYYFVDKTLMIKEFLESGAEVTLVTRPRRFGKTLNMSMMSEFFDITKDSKDIFKDTLIANTPYIKEMNQYPTIFLSFAEAKGTEENIRRMIKDCLLKEYARFQYIFNDMSDLYQSKYQEIKKSIINSTSSLSTLTLSLSFLIEMLERYYHKKVIVLIDEYDTPFIEAYVHGFYNNINVDISTMLQSALKSSASLQYAMLSGIQRVAKENIFSGLNNIDICTVVNQRYSQYFGFDSNETKALLEYYALSLNGDVKSMYDGYRFGDVEIYNPWSIVNYAKNHYLIPFWVNTSSNIMIKNIMKQVDYGFKEQFDSLIENGYLDTEVLMTTSFYENPSLASLWGLLVNAGYLTVKQVLDQEDEYCRIVIPNGEVRREFVTLTENYYGIEETSLNRMFRALVSCKQDEFLKEYLRLLTIPSYHDLMSENSYHMLVLGASLVLIDRYKVISNREEGLGRCDIILVSKDNQPSFVLEFKYLKSNQEDVKEHLDTLAHEAIKQIRDKKYDSELKGRVIYIGLAHRNKEVVMKWQEK